MLQVDGLRKTYGERPALDGVDLWVEAGEICGVLGPNGAGKTTLVSVICGLLRPDSGSVTVGPYDALLHSDRARSLIGLAPQETGIYPSLTVRDNLRFAGQLVGLWGSALGSRIDEVAQAFEMVDLLDRQAHGMSGGEQRRLHTAMAILHRPPLLLLDEPTTGVDVGSRVRLLSTIKNLAGEWGSAVCYSTHYLPEVEALQASVAIIDEGRVIARGNPDELIAQHAESAIELRFDGAAPESLGSLDCRRQGDVLLVAAPRPAAELPAVMAALGEDAHRIRSVELLQPNLESLFLKLTGRRYDAERDATEPFRSGYPVQTEEQR